jgi:hypothetical protein
MQIGVLPTQPAGRYERASPSTELCQRSTNRALRLASPRLRKPAMRTNHVVGGSSDNRHSQVFRREKNPLSANAPQSAANERIQKSEDAKQHDANGF